MSANSSDETLSRLHALITEAFIAILESDTPPTAAELNVIRQFLKDNGIDMIAKPGTPIHQLARALPFTDKDLSNAS